MSSRRPPRILLSAGEASGDRLGAGLAAALRERRPDVELLGMGGERMQRAGMRRIQDAAAVSVVGFFDVLAHLRPIREAMRRLERALDEERPDLVVPIDFPDFNLRLAARASSRGIPVVYYVSPQVWAWRRRRVHRIRRLVRRMLVLFPFEQDIYHAAGLPVTFVGYPVTPRAPAATLRELRAALGFGPDETIVALLPGSRRIEVERQLPTMLEAARQLQLRRPDVRFLLPVAPGLPADWLGEQVRDQVRMKLHAGDYPAVLELCAAGVAAAGTATLDCALAGLPIVVVYRLGGLSYRLGRLLVRLEHVALPNLVAGRRVAPELLQDDFDPETVAAELLDFLESPERAARVRQGWSEVRQALGQHDAFAQAAEAVLGELEPAGRPE